MIGDQLDKSQKFRDAANRRVRNVELTLRRIRSLSNPSSYSYTEEEVQKIFDHLQDELNITRDSFFRQAERRNFCL